MLLEDQRHLHEDLERLEDAAAERLLEDPPHVSTALSCRIAFHQHALSSRIALY
ncbi:predicted protein [Plenodomus lingam JN3]|uniref:Predicted protein n=1 Tax=Leptosphaeria maculans (strain JN3 / isolate v23.1.3 / race Av1-4-5-6-7-8) TaxID=985895 RepID=E5AEJ5_LEPMJ|nr:predicted protein [Plenodomus lingam JN3]CBY01634.1 predicted protein [Plenodomus lingam JN3]